ncbi:MAG: bifunctional (p)ppGpp synthetase/guanosine-3',5'-bis(diphosphate) 3'-pyrophosphohydrolase [Bacteroidales bacterium]|nr:bifunctional (p)ppGpp synthetase/guanosine-3',5'-bis(diphosphate) 3'-pyrophosphohydrolase [Bacteroidales bacterium]
MQQADQLQERSAILGKYRRLLSAWKPTDEKERRLVRKTFQFAAEAHRTMRRKTGEPYIFHPLEVARIVAEEIGLGTVSIQCALLHDVVEDTEYSLQDIEHLFGKTVARIIDGLTKIGDIFDQTSSLQAENFKKMLLTLSDDVRVILIKLADRLHNMRTLGALPKDKQLKIASETLYLFAPLAHRLGLYAIKTELEDLALKYTEPDIYRDIVEKLRESEKERKRFITKFILPLKKSLNQEHFKFRIITREKSVHSIWEKMKAKGIPFEEVYDLFAVRIIIDTPPEKEKVDCWRVYSIVTDHYRPNIDRLRDWISIPKANGYEALHTTVMSNTGQWVEVQVRTLRMDEIAEKGFAAHWRYKDGEPVNRETNIDRWLNRIRDILQSSDSTALDFVDDFKGFLFTDEIYVFTPRGELRNLPVNSSVLDFAYAIHSEIGNTCIGAKVNHKLAPMNHRLRSGDQVEVLTSQKQLPREEWFSYVVTTRAKTQIKNAIREEKKKYYEEGRQLLEKYLEELVLKPDPAHLALIQRKYNYPTPLDLFYDLARGVIGRKEVRIAITRDSKGRWFSQIIRLPFKSRGSDHNTLSETIIEAISGNEDNHPAKGGTHKISYDIADCCHPIPGDEIVGFIRPNEAIRIHRTNCPVAIDEMSKFGNRIIKTIWNDSETVGFLTGIRISGIDKKGIIKEIIHVITEEMNLNIHSFHLESNGGIISATTMLYVYSTRNLSQLISLLKKNPDVREVMRIK